MLYAFDGTWNNTEEGSVPTNVVKFRDRYVGDVFYLDGIGTRRGRVGAVVGGLFGLGGKKRQREALKHLRETHAADPVIDIIGFSRGAALAVDFANHVVQEYESEARIRFLGLFDVVGAFGLAVGHFQQVNLGYELTIPTEHVDTAIHAVSINEGRSSFAPTLQAGAHEVWFRGVHSDIGGGNDNIGLNDIALRWFVRRARQAGVEVEDPPEGYQTDPQAAPYRNKDIIDRPRQVPAEAIYHYTVPDAPAGARIETEQDERGS